MMLRYADNGPMHIKSDSQQLCSSPPHTRYHSIVMSRNTDSSTRGTELISLNSSRRNEPTESTPEDDYNAWKEASDDLTATRSIITSAENGGMSKSAIDSFRERADKLQQTVEHYETMIPSLKKH